jgi:hypothetical protein
MKGLRSMSALNALLDLRSMNALSSIKDLRSMNALNALLGFTFNERIERLARIESNEDYWDYEPERWGGEDD